MSARVKSIVTEVALRRYSTQIFHFDNGCFVAITEGSNKLGSMIVSMPSGPGSISTTIIPSKTDSLFLQLTAETISNSIKGISIVSLHLNKELDPKSAKAIMNDILELIRDE